MKQKNKIKVGILGATGMVGQNYVYLLSNHPIFEIVELSASKKSAGKYYLDIVKNKWYMPSPIPKNVQYLILRDVHDIDTINKKVDFFFSAISLEDKIKTKKFEFIYAKKGYPVITNSSANRLTEDVPMIIPEINHYHSKIIKYQQKSRGLSNGFVASKPNCSIQSYVLAIHALEQSGHKIKNIQVITLQALSGGGIASVYSENMKQNVTPYIQEEEIKTEVEPLKIFGVLCKDKIQNNNFLNISATCTRVPVIDGHTAIVFASFEKKPPSLNQVKSIWRNYAPPDFIKNLPSSPKKAIIYHANKDRPQPRIDVMTGNGMSLTLGRLRKDKFFDISFIGLSHNTIRGAAGGAILMAELLEKQGYIFGK